MKRKTLVLITIISFLLVVTLHISVAIFTTLKNGLMETSIEIGDLTFKYTDITGVGNGINISEAEPTSDSDGKVLDTYFDFKVDAKLTRSDIKYSVLVEPTGNSTVNLNGIKVYITELVDGDEKEIEMK